jgi:hypothetical protein
MNVKTILPNLTAASLSNLTNSTNSISESPDTENGVQGFIIYAKLLTLIIQDIQLADV